MIAKRRLVLVMLGTALVIAAGRARAHGGGRDKLGCHHDRKNGGYHCHSTNRVIVASAQELSTMPPETEPMVLGVDLDGVCADFYGRMRAVAAEWFERPLHELTEDVFYGLREWGIESPSNIVAFIASL